MAIPHAKPGEVVDVRPLGSALASAQTKTLVRAEQVEVPLRRLGCGALPAWASAYRLSTGQMCRRAPGRNPGGDGTRSAAASQGGYPLSKIGLDYRLRTGAPSAFLRPRQRRCWCQ
jgi:hypothetical protein